MEYKYPKKCADNLCLVISGRSKELPSEALSEIREKFAEGGFDFDDYRYIYSFVGDQSLFDMLIANRKCLLIVPESLSRVIRYESSIENVHIDLGY